MGATEPAERGRRAVFLDRDGVINRNVFYADTGQYESPRTAEEFALLPGVPEALMRLRDAGFLLFLVSNQPNYAKGKCSLAELDAIDAAFEHGMSAIGIAFTAIYYCLHHPDGKVSGYSGPCVCRKPSPYFLLKAIRTFNLDAERCWMVGDRPTDVLCGLVAGVPTILIREPGGEDGTFASRTAPDLAAASLVVCADMQTHSPSPLGVEARQTAEEPTILNPPKPHLPLSQARSKERTPWPASLKRSSSDQTALRSPSTPSGLPLHSLRRPEPSSY